MMVDISGWINKTWSDQSRKEPESNGGEGWVFPMLQNREEKKKNREEDQKAIWNLPVPIKKPRVMSLRTGNSP